MVALNPQNRIYLASKSPRRRELLKQIGVNFEVLLLREFPATRQDIDERPHAAEAPDEYVLRVARQKAEIGAQRVVERRLPILPVLSADTSVVLGTNIIGKPADTNGAINTLRQLSGKTHQVMSAVAISNAGQVHSVLSITEVRFRELSDDEIRRYVACGEPMDKAGAYGIQGKAAAFIAGISGSYSGVVGLPLFETVELLKKIHFPIS
ncbi:MAG TPA: Maf family protein [Burkholderiales bacterium]|nr:Maf family protein [Burkholderiales bacterium]